MSEYDRVEYPSKPFPQCHPDRLAVMARLFGLAAAPVKTCRVLEIGCGDGLNLIASAIVLPEARFFGIDLSAKAIRRGRRLLREVGLKNVRLEERDLRTWVPPAKGFDYVIAHGLYSWLSPPLRDTLLAAVRSALRPDGIAFVSYNAYPGAYLRRMVREMAGLLADGELGQAREWLEAARQLPDGPPLYRAVVADEAADMLQREAGALFHDDFAGVNEPCWFRDFAAHAALHDLQYVSEAGLDTTGSQGLSPEGAQYAALFAAGDRIRLEQAADTFRGRRFRQTLLCPGSRQVRGEPAAGALRSCFAGGPLNPGISHSDGTFEFTNRTGGSYRTASPEERAILESAAAAWPDYLPLDQFGEASFPVFLKLFAANMLDIRTAPPFVAGRRVMRPETSPLARSQASRRAPLTSLHHLEVFIESDSLRNVLLLADGKRTRAGIIRDLVRLYPTEPKEKVALALDQHLLELRQYGLLIS